MTIRFDPRFTPHARPRRSVVFDPARGVYQRPILEEDVVKEIMARLGYLRIKVFRERERRPIAMNGKVKYFGAQASDGGHPDLHGWIPKGRILFKVKDMALPAMAALFPIPFYIEVKRPGGRRRPKQIKFIEEAEADGVIAFFAESWQEVQEGFGNHGINL